MVLINCLSKAAVVKLNSCFAWDVTPKKLLTLGYACAVDKALLREACINNVITEVFSRRASVLKTLPLSMLLVKGKAKGMCMYGGRHLHQDCSPFNFHKKI